MLVTAVGSFLPVTASGIVKSHLPEASLRYNVYILMDKEAMYKVQISRGFAVPALLPWFCVLSTSPPVARGQVLYSVCFITRRLNILQYGTALTANAPSNAASFSNLLNRPSLPNPIHSNHHVFSSSIVPWQCTVEPFFSSSHLSEQ
jgi:hypothetical protein